MARIADISASSGEPLFICDFSPPRGAAFNDSHAAQSLDAHSFSIPYNPGKSVYANSAIAAHSIKSLTGKEVVFTLATRDMNILATQSLLLGAALLGLQNVIVVRGDDFTPAELRRSKPVHDSTTTSLIRSIAGMNEGTDFRGRALSPSTDFCIGATIDVNRSLESELSLTQRKIDAGAHFFVTQPTLATDLPLQFLDGYEPYRDKKIPVFFGVQMIATGSRSFSAVPPSIRSDLAAGMSSTDIAIRTIDAFLKAGISNFYLMPPIFPGGARDYHSAQQVLLHFHSS